eukprot:g6186.t1
MGEFSDSDLDVDALICATQQAEKMRDAELEDIKSMEREIQPMSYFTSLSQRYYSQRSEDREKTSSSSYSSSKKERRKNLPAKFVLISLFDGIGGAKLSLEAAGVHVAEEDFYSVEISETARAVVKTHYPNSSVLAKDVLDLHEETIRSLVFNYKEQEENSNEEFQVVFIVACGSPCQNLSSAQDIDRHSKGTLGEKSSLLFAAVDITHWVQKYADSYWGWRNNKRTGSKNGFKYRFTSTYFLFENVASMSEWDQNVFSLFLGRMRPIELRGENYKPMKRRRLFWINWVSPLFDRKSGKSHCYKDCVDLIIQTSGHRVRPNFEKQHGVFPTLLCSPYSKGQDRNTVVDHGNVRPLNGNECEALLGFPTSWTDINYCNGLETKESIRRKLLGNTFMIPQVADLFSSLKHLPPLFYDEEPVFISRVHKAEQTVQKYTFKKQNQLKVVISKLVEERASRCKTARKRSLNNLQQSKQKKIKEMFPMRQTSSR